MNRTNGPLITMKYSWWHFPLSHDTSYGKPCYILLCRKATAGLWSNGKSLSGTSIAIEVDEECTYDAFREAGIQKLALFCPHIMAELTDSPDSYKVVFKGGANVDPIPGTELPFSQV